MCYGSLDPKYALKEAEARLKQVARAPADEPRATSGAVGAIRTVLARLAGLIGAAPVRRGDARP